LFGKKRRYGKLGSSMSIYPPLSKAGITVAQMIECSNIKTIIPQWPSTGVTFDLTKPKSLVLSFPKS